MFLVEKYLMQESIVEAGYHRIFVLYLAESKRLCVLMGIFF